MSRIPHRLIKWKTLTLFNMWCLILTLFLYVSGTVEAAPPFDAAQYTGSKGAVQNLINANIGSFNCPYQEKAITAFVLFSGGTPKLVVSWNFGGFNGSMQTPYMDGACTNGFYVGGKYYKWVWNNGIGYQEDPSLAGSCLLVSSMGPDDLMSAVGITVGGMSNTAAAGASIALTVQPYDAVASSFSITYMSPKQCTQGTDPNLEQYYSNPGALTGAGTQAMTTQSTDPNSYYSQVQKTSYLDYGSGQTIGIPNIVSCTVSQSPQVTLGTVYLDFSCPATDTTFIYTDPPPLDYITHTLPVHLNYGRNGDVAVVWGRYDSWNNYNIRGTYQCQGGSWTLTGTAAGGCSNGKWACTEVCPSGYSYSPLPQGYAFATTYQTTCYQGGGSGYFYYGGGGYSTNNISTNIETGISLVQSNTCPSSCQLKNEWVCDRNGSGCIQTVQTGTALSMTLQPQCFQHNSTNYTYLVCSDGQNVTYRRSDGQTGAIGTGWFYVKREYNCGNTSINLNLDREKSIVNTTNLANNFVNYTDPDTGQPNSVDISKAASTGCNVKYCRIYTITTTQPQITGDGTPKPPTANKTYNLKACDSNNVCPLASGEILDRDCFCPSDMDLKMGLQAIMGMKVLDEARKNFICSGN